MIKILSKLTSVFILCLGPIFLLAQDAGGNFEGALDVNGIKLEMRIQIETTPDGLNGTLDIPLQGVKGMNLDDLKIKESDLSFRLPEVPGNASYSGTFNADFSKLDGKFVQGGVELPLVFVRIDDAIIAEKIEGIKALTDSLRKLQQVPAIGFGIVKNGKVVMAEGFGKRNLEGELDADASTMFAIGSSSKAFTSMGLGILVNDGKLDWEEPIRTYLPEFELMDPFASQEMNAIDLLCHRSGLPRHDLLWYGTGFSRDALFQKLKHLEPSAPFRTKWQYQNLMFMTAGVLIEDLSGMSWEEFTKTRIFDPLGMVNSNFSIEKLKNHENAAIGYRKDEEEVIAMDYRNIDAIGPAGSINSNVNDMLKWVNFQLALGKVDDQELVSSSIVQNMHQPHMSRYGVNPANPNIKNGAYGLAWFIYNYEGKYIVQHGGNIDGFSALVFMIPEHDLGMVILTNMNGTGIPTILAHSATDILLDIEPKDWYTRAYGSENDEDEDEDEDPEQLRVEGTSPTHDLKDYTGTYQHPSYGDCIITLKGEQLHMKYYTFEADINHWHYELFKGEVDPIGELEVYFVSDKNGAIVGLKTSMDPMVDDILFSKLPPDYLKDPEFLTLLCGKYDLNSTIVTVEIIGNDLTVTVPGQPTYTLVPKKDTEFNLKGLNGFSVSFQLTDDELSTKGLKFIQPNGIFEATRKKD
ncbi:MAG: serine hydrolase [Bacteroidia bacterium]|nr:serine hydrolase [Bacteroidia bacterium]